MDDPTLYIIGINTKKSDRQLRRFGKAHHKWHSREAPKELSWIIVKKQLLLHTQRWTAIAKKTLMRV